MSRNVKTFESFINEGRNNSVDVKHDGKKIKVDLDTVEIDGIDTRDYPDFSDAYFSYAEDHKGRELTDAEIDSLNDQHYDIVNELIHDNQLYM